MIGCSNRPQEDNIYRQGSYSGFSEEPPPEISRLRGWQPVQQLPGRKQGMGPSWQQSQQGPKEMTRHQHHSAANSDCFSLCKQFIKNCYATTQVSNRQAHYLQVLINTMNLQISCQRLAGRVGYFISTWEVLTQDQWVL